MQRSVLPYFFRWAMLLLLALPFTAGAQMFYAPGSSTVTLSSNSYPLYYVSTSNIANICQWLYTPADFNAAMPNGVTITRVYIKPSTTNAGYSYQSLTLKLGNTALTTLTSGPWVSGLTTVWSNAPATITTTSGTWLAFTLSTPITYTGGNLIFELSQTSSTASLINIGQYNPSSGNRRMYGNTANANSSGADGSYAAIGFDVNCFGNPQAPAITSTFNPATPVCSGGTATIAATNPNVAQGVSLQWQSSASATGPWTNVTNGSGATSLNYTTGALTTGTYFRLNATCTFSNLSTGSSPVYVPVGAPQPGTISGLTTFCPNDPSVYSVVAAPGTTYAWTLPTGWTSVLTNPPATNAITVTPNGTGGTVSVTATATCGVSIAQTRSVVAGSAPVAPASITGNRLICNNSPQTYAVAQVPGVTSYVWTLPSGWVGSSTTNTINVTNTTTAGNVTVRAVNGCGQSPATVLPVSFITTLANPGTITGKDTVCSGALQTYSINPVNGATSYVWTLPSGWSGTTSGTSVQVFGAATSGAIRVTAYVSCATSPTASKQLTGIASVTPTVSVTAPSTVLCQSQPLTFTATATDGGKNPVYIWRRNGNTVSGTGSTYTSASLNSGDQISVTLNSDASCATTTSVTSAPVAVRLLPAVVPGISINSLPEASICSGMNVDFFATATGGGNGPKYQWYKNDVAIAGANGLRYSTSSLANGDTIRVVMTSDAVCATATTISSNKAGIHVSESLVPSVSISVSPSNIITPGQPVTFTATQSNGGTNPDYQWFRNGVTIPFATGATYTSSNLQPNDNISVRMLSYLSCVSPKTGTSNVIVMHAGALSVPGATGTNGLSLYPNPSTGTLNVRGDAAVRGGLRMEVLSTVGQVVYRVEQPAAASVSGWNQSIELPANLAAGHYVLRVSTETDGNRQNLATLPFILHK